MYGKQPEESAVAWTSVSGTEGFDAAWTTVGAGDKSSKLTLFRPVGILADTLDLGDVSAVEAA